MQYSFGVTSTRHCLGAVRQKGRIHDAAHGRSSNSPYCRTIKRPRRVRPEQRGFRPPALNSDEAPGQKSVSVHGGEGHFGKIREVNERAGRKAAGGAQDARGAGEVRHRPGAKSTSCSISYLPSPARRAARRGLMSILTHPGAALSGAAAGSQKLHRLREAGVRGHAQLR